MKSKPLSATNPKPNIDAAPPAALSAKQAASLLGVSLRHFHNLRKREDFPKGRLLGARAVRWLRVELDHWLASLPITDPDRVGERFKCGSRVGTDRAVAR